jgi:hypothetical protein
MRISIDIKWRLAITVLLVCVLFSGSLAAQAVLKVSDAKKSFGFVKQGKEVKIEYEVKNTGIEPLVISDIKIECSCTKADFPKEPILPQQTRTIVLMIDTKTMQDRQDRTVEIISNNKEGSVFLRYKGVVLRN